MVSTSCSRCLDYASWSETWIRCTSLLLLRCRDCSIAATTGRVLRRRRSCRGAALRQQPGLRRPLLGRARRTLHPQRCPLPEREDLVYGPRCCCSHDVCSQQVLVGSLPHGRSVRLRSLNTCDADRVYPAQLPALSKANITSRALKWFGFLAEHAALGLLADPGGRVCAYLAEFRRHEGRRHSRRLALRRRTPWCVNLSRLVRLPLCSLPQ